MKKTTSTGGVPAEHMKDFPISNHKNAFDLLRLLLALCVLITHGLLIGGYKLSDPLSVLSKNQTSFAEVGVMGFFALSGFLITASFERTKNVLVFASHRLLRIMPGFWVCLLVTGFVLAPLIRTIRAEPAGHFDFFGHDGAWGFFVHNFFLKIGQWSIRDVLTFASYKESLNGSLWSLYPEMQCYCFTLTAGYLGLFDRNRLLYLFFAISIFLFFAINVNFFKSYGPTFLILSPAFKVYIAYLAGSFVFVFREQLSFDRKGTAFLFLFTLALIKFGGFHLISPLLIALTLVNVFRQFRVNFKFDVSYGVYIYAFPIQQLLFQVFENHLPATLFITLSFVLSLGAGFLSFVLIEKPFMNLKRKTDPLLIKFHGNEKSN